MFTPDIYQYVKSEEANFEGNDIQVGQNWHWNFRKHVQLIFHLKNGVFFTGENNWLRAFKQIMRPLLRLSYWTEDIEVKDVVFYIESENGRALSFLVKKYHDEVFVKENDLDTLFDKITESDIDYGGVLIQNVKTGEPEVIPLNAVAFCDQTYALGSPLGLKYNFSPDKLRGMASKGWGSADNGATITLDELAMLAQSEKDTPGVMDTKTNKVPGQTIEVYIVRGNMPEHYLLDNNNMEDVYNQLQVIAYYVDKSKKRQGVTLYRKKEAEGSLVFHTSEEIHGRALGYSDGEAFLHPQVWTNFIEIHEMDMLAAGAKTPLVTDDPSFSNRNKIQDMENNEIVTIEDGKTITAIPTISTNAIQLYEKKADLLLQSAQFQGSAFDPILGKEQASGTTFRGQERTVAQGRGWHDRRRGQRAKLIEKLYREGIIPRMVREINKGKKFLASLSVEELAWVGEQMAENYANKKLKEKIMKGEVVSKEDQENFKITFKEIFSKRGNRQLIEVLKGEFEGIEVKIGINVAGKQKDLVNLTDKILSVFQFVFANPQGFQQAMQIPALSKAFGDILEFSGLSIADFNGLVNAPAPAVQPGNQPTQPAPSPLQLNKQPAEV